MKRGINIVSVMVMFLFIVATCFAQEIVDISATIEPTSQLNVEIIKVTLPDNIPTNWDPGQASMDFGTLIFDTENNIFTADNFYYVLDIGIVDNSGTWTLTHTRSSMTNGSANLNTNINVTAVEQVNATTDNPLDAVSYANANGLSWTQSDISAGSWIRIYYGIATGLGDNTGVTPIGVGKPAGTYSGQITLTLT